MIRSFKDRATEDIFNGISSKAARKACPVNLWRVAGRKLDQLDSVMLLDELKVPPGNQLELLHGDREGQYRICFTWHVDGPLDIEITDYH